MNKAYIVTVGDMTTYINGETAGKAKANAYKGLQEADYTQYKFTDITVRRFYKFDPVAEKFGNTPRNSEYMEEQLFKHKYNF